MPSYDVRCRACGTTFEIQRPMARVDEPAPCPLGHDDTVRLLPTVAFTGLTGGRGVRATSSAGGGCGAGGGCCGGACAG